MAISTSIIIPTLNAQSEIGGLLKSLHSQTVKPEEILVIDSSSEDETVSICEKFDSVRVHVIKREEFDHGGTRHLGTELTSGDFILFLTQDAIPVSEHYVENIIAPMLADNEIAMVTGRQVPKEGSRHYVQIVQEYNYPCTSNVRDVSDIPKMGIKAFFASDVCSAYRRSTYSECGGFARPLSTNEDMLMAATFLAKGWKVAYEASAQVFHSHNLTFKQQYERNKLVGGFLASHTQELRGAKETSEGKKLVKYVSKQLLKERRFIEFAMFGLDCTARFLGNKAGKKM